MAIQLTIKLMNGELLNVTHRTEDRLYGLFEKIYTACPEIPKGCLRLVPFDTEDAKDEEEDEERQLMRLADLYSTHSGVFQGPVVDGDVLRAVVDSSLITLRFDYGRTYEMTDDLSGFYHVDCYYLDFYTQCPDIDEPMLVATLAFIYHQERGFAAHNTFEIMSREKPRRYGVIRPTTETIWYPTLTDLIRHADGNHPRMLDLCELAEDFFVEGDFTKSASLVAEDDDDEHEDW
jgi:hypothetical protein